MVKTTDCGSVMRGFESHNPPHKKDFGFSQGLFYMCCEDENPQNAKHLWSFEEPYKAELGLGSL